MSKITIDERLNSLPERTRKRIAKLLRDDLFLVNVAYTYTYGAPFDMICDLPGKSREDPVLIDYIQRQKKDNLAVCKAVKDFYVFDEYDGKESLFTRDKRLPIKEIVYDTTLDDSQKIGKLRYMYETLLDQQERARRIHCMLAPMNETHARNQV